MSQMPIQGPAFKKLSVADKRAKITRDDVWPFESMAKGRDDEILVAVVHRASAETVQSVVLSDQLQNCFACFWYFSAGDGSDVQRTYIQERSGGESMAKGRDDEILVAVVHRASAETVQSVVLSDQLQNCFACFW